MPHQPCSLIGRNIARLVFVIATITHKRMRHMPLTMATYFPSPTYRWQVCYHVCLVNYQIRPDSHTRQGHG